MTATQPRIVATGRLVRLREKTVEDAERDYAWRTDQELAAYDAARPLTVRFTNFVATLAEELKYPTAHRRTFGIDDLATGRHIGNIMYYGYDAKQREAEIGITIGDREYWSRGLGVDVVQAMLGYLFEEKRLHLRSPIQPVVVRSGRLDALRKALVEHPLRHVGRDAEQPRHFGGADGLAFGIRHYAALAARRAAVSSPLK